MATEVQGDSIEHWGVIKEITSESIRVSLINVSACSSCHTKGACSVADVDNKVIDVVNPGGDFKKGQMVKVVFQKSLGPLALFLGYLFPFIFMMIVLVASMSMTNDEVMSGIAALLAVVVYYLVLTLFRKKLKATFTFRIQKTQT